MNVFELKYRKNPELLVDDVLSLSDDPATIVATIAVLLELSWNESDYAKRLRDAASKKGMTLPDLPALLEEI